MARTLLPPGEVLEVHLTVTLALSGADAQPIVRHGLTHAVQHVVGEVLSGLTLAIAVGEHDVDTVPELAAHVRADVLEVAAEECP